MLDFAAVHFQSIHPRGLHKSFNLVPVIMFGQLWWLRPGSFNSNQIPRPMELLPLDPYELLGLIQTKSLQPSTVRIGCQIPCHSLSCKHLQDFLARLRSQEPATWAEIPVALHVTRPDGKTHYLHLSLRHPRLPHAGMTYNAAGFPMVLHVSGSNADHWGPVVPP